MDNEPQTEMSYGQPQPQQAGEQRPSWDDVPTVDPARSALVKEWEQKIQEAEKHWEKFFKRTRQCEQLAFAGADKAWVAGDNYTVPVIPRHINQTVAALYAKDPRVSAKRRKRLQYQLWDGDLDSLQTILQKIQMAQQMLATGGMATPIDPTDMAILQEIQQVEQHNAMIDKLGKTLEILWTYFTGEQALTFKLALKATVRRAKVTSVGYCQLNYQRILEANPDVSAKIQDITSKIKSVESAIELLHDDKVPEDSPELEQLRTNLKDLQNQEMIVVREGPVFSWPKTRDIILDPGITHLKTFEGCGWYARKFLMAPDRVYETYKVKINASYTEHYPTSDENGKRVQRSKAKPMACLYEIHDERNRQCLVIAKGYPDFVAEPQDPDVKLERFWNLFPLVFNEVENEDEVFPPSDVWLMRHPQQDVNRARQGLREHRVANRPKYVTPTGALEEEDKKKLSGAAAHEILELQGLTPGEDVNKKIMKFDHTGIDPNQYQVEEHHKDILRSVGSSEAGMGMVSGGTATENSIAENARMAATSDNVDELDDFLSELAKATGQLMLLELGHDTVVEIVGPGAVWPDAKPTREEIAKDLLLDVRAGSSGRPNRAAELANMERAAPYVLQIPGVNPKPLAEKYADILDIDVEELYTAGVPSIAARNQIAGGMLQGVGEGEQADPAAQGDKGKANGAKPAPNRVGPQAPYPNSAAPAGGVGPGGPLN